MRKTFAIPGGIHPPENKHQSLQSPIGFAGIPEQLILPLSQHIGAPAKPCVSIGERVLKGQKIAEAQGFVSLPVHAPTSGSIKAIENRQLPHPSGLAGPCIVIETDQQDEWAELNPMHSPELATKEQLLNAIREAGIAGMGGAGFPSPVKLAGKPDATINTLIINGTECEPYITADDILMQERAELIITGISLLARIVEPEEVLIGIEDNKPNAIAAMQAAAEHTNFEVVSFPTKYPSGGEKQLIQILTGEEVPTGGLPADLGIVVQNVGTAAAIATAICSGEPIISRVTTVTGEGVEQPQNFEVLLGTPMSFVLQQAGFSEQNSQRLIMGGPMMGFALEDTETPIVKTTNCLLAPSQQELPEPHPQQACIRCGMCVQACPASLLPQQMYWFSQAKELEKLEAHNVFDCIECGACSYVCPSSIPLVQYFRSGKAGIRQAAEDAKEAERAKERFEARQARQEREEAEKAAKREARKKAAAAKSAGKDDAVAAALARVNAKKAAKVEEAAPSTDPVQAAIERAKAQRAGTATVDTNAKREKLQARLDKAKQRLDDAKANNDDNLPAFENAVSKLESQLAELPTAEAPQQNKQDNKPESAELDPVQAAIERAKAKRAGNHQEDASEKRNKLQARLDKANTRLDDAKSRNDENLAAFEAAVAKLEKQMAELAEATPESASETTPESAPENQPESAAVNEPEAAAELDPVQAAIERAKAKRAGTHQEDPNEKRNKLQARLAKAEQRLADAKANNDDNISAFETAVTKLNDQLSKLEREH